MLLLHVSDTHLGASKPLTYSKSRELDFYEVFDEVVDIAVRERVDAVIHCGDFFDSPDPSPRAYYYAIRSLKRLSEVGIPFLVIAGQHDQPRRAEMSPLKILEEVGVARALALGEPGFHVVNLRGGELRIFAIPYGPPEVVRDWARVVRKPEARRGVLMAHLLLKELGLPASHLSLYELGVEGFGYVALGDHHKKYVTSLGGVPVVYPGSTEALKVDERSDERYVALVDMSRDVAAVSWVRLSRFRRIAVVEEISSFGDLVRALSRLELGKLGKPPILYVKLGRLMDPHGLDQERVASKLGELVRQGSILAYRVVVPEVVGSEEVGEEAESEEPPPTLEYVVYEAARDPEVAEFLVKMIRSSDDAEAVKRLVLGVLDDDKLLRKLEKMVARK